MGDVEVQNDAKWLAENVILPGLKEIKETVNNHNTKIWEMLDKTRECQTQLKLNDEKITGELNQVKVSQKITEQALVRHVENKEKHFNPFYSETVAQKLWRKKTEIAAGGGVGTLIVSLLMLIIKLLGGT